MPYKNCSSQANPSIHAVVRFTARGLCALPVFLLCLGSTPALAAVDDILQAIRQSEFRFGRTVSEVPFFPLGWAQFQYYPSTEFKDEHGKLAPAEAGERTFDMGGVFPTYVHARDMVLLGGDIAWDTVNVQSGPYRDQRIVRVTPVAAWLHQFGRDHTVGTFVAPVLSKETKQPDQPWTTNGFAGVIAMYWYSDTLQWYYGGVYETYFGVDYFYPYLGLQWNPTPQWSIAALFPWPTISYAPAKGWIVQLGIAPGGSSWLAHNNGYETTQVLGSWNTSFGVARQLSGPWWLSAGVGRTGFRGASQDRSGNETTLDAEPSPVYTIALQFRP